MARKKLNLPDGPARDKFTAAAEQLAEDIIGTLERALKAEQVYNVKCHHCHKDWKYPFPDMGALIKAAQFLIDNGIGKPAQQKPAPEKPKTESLKLEELSDEDLFALLDNLEDQDGKAHGSAA